MAVSPVYSDAFDHFAPAEVRGNDRVRRAWAAQRLKQAAAASAKLGLRAHATFSGSLARRFSTRGRHTMKRVFRKHSVNWQTAGDRFWISSMRTGWTSVLSCIGEDLHDGVTFERFLHLLDNHPRCNILYDPSHMLLQQMDYPPLSISITRVSKRFT